MADEVTLAAIVGARVRELRIAKKWSQRALADRMQTAQSRVSELENGAQWTTDQIEAAAAALGVSVSALRLHDHDVPGRHLVDATAAGQHLGDVDAPGGLPAEKTTSLERKPGDRSSRDFTRQ